MTAKRKRKPDPGAAGRMRKHREAKKAAKRMLATDLVRMQGAGPQLPLPGIAPPEAKPVPIRQAEMRARILAIYPSASSIVQWAEIISRPVELLAQQLQCTRLEAHEQQEKARVKLAEYLDQKAPIAIQTDGPPIAPIHLHIGAASVGSAHDQGLVIDVLPGTPVTRGDDA